MNRIHPTALVSKKAELGDNITIGPFSIIHDNVSISDDCSIAAHAVLYDGARLSKNVQIYQGASVANLPQDLKFKEEDSEFIIGENTIIREFATLHRGTVDKGFSKIGKDCLLMAYTHVAHDCIIGDNCILANGVQVGGHAVLEDWVIIGGLTPVHQFVKIGQHTMVGGGFRVTYDVPPFVLASGEPLKYFGINLLGLKRRGFTAENLDNLKKAYRILYQSGLNLSMARERCEMELGTDENVRKVLDFMNNIKRSGFK